MTGPVDRGVQRIVDAVDSDALGEAIAGVIVASIPEIGDRGDEDLRLAVVANASRSVAEALEGLRDGATDDFTPPEAAIAFAHALVHRGIGLAALLRTYRLGHAVAEERLREIAADELELDPEVRWEVLTRASRILFGYVDAICSQLADTYVQERERWVRGAAAVRAECVGAVLAGDVVDPDHAARILDHDMKARTVAFIVWTDPREAGAAGAAELEIAATGLAGELGGGAPLIVVVGDSVVWGWTGGDAVVDQPPEGRALPGGVRAAVGTPREGIEGFVRSHREAQLARRAAGLLARRPGSVTRHEAVALVALTTAEPDEAARFVEHELGELAQPSDAMARLRATLRAYYEENASPVRTARRLGVHQNTIVYRVNRAEEILGRPMADRRLELEVALRLADSLEDLRAGAD